MSDTNLPPDAAQPKQAPQNAARPWMRILLVVSLGLNLATAGMVVGAKLAGGDHRNWSRGGEDARIGPYGRAFSKEDRALLRRSFGARQEAFRAHRKTMRAAAAALVETLRAEPFDIDAARAALATQRSAQIALQDEGQEVMLAHLANMTPEARAAFADTLEKGLKRRKPR